MIPTPAVYSSVGRTSPAVDLGRQRSKTGVTCILVRLYLYVLYACSSIIAFRCSILHDHMVYRTYGEVETLHALRDAGAVLLDEGKVSHTSSSIVMRWLPAYERHGTKRDHGYKYPRLGTLTEASSPA